MLKISLKFRNSNAVKCDKIKIFFVFYPNKKEKLACKSKRAKNQIVFFLAQSDYQNGNVGR